jgi:3-methylcrotonyl-CoA carboxylase alpha subunit
VEHPVTEMITKQDLVEWQLRIAAGEELPIKDQDLIPCIGNSMEARIYTENPAKDFLPATGHVWHHHPPFPPNIGGKNVRVDTGLQEGKDISVYYDPMISKLIVHGKDREEARVRLIESLQNYQIAGVPTNIPFLIKCAQHPVFAEAGAINTGFLDDYADDVKAATYTSPMDRAVCGLVASLALEARCATDLSTTQQNIGPWSTSSGSWRLGTRHERVLKVAESCVDDDNVKITCNHDGSFSFDSKIGEETFPMTLKASFHTDKTLRVLVNGSEKQEYIAISKVCIIDGKIEVNLWPTEKSQLGINAVRMVFEHPLYSKQNRASSVLAMEGKGSIFVKAPMPGTITRMNFQEGDNVGKSDVILVMEAMKMEHAVTAKMAGIISKLSCEVGDIINDSDVLCVLREDTLVDNTHAAKV